jgi:rod shape-determining protein MreC
MARTRSTVLILVVASLALILWDLRASDTAARSVALQVVAPLQRTATSLFAPLGAWARDVEGFTDPVVRAQSAAPIDPVVPAGWRTAQGRVIAADIAADRGAVTVDVGAALGVRPGNAVLAPGGVVGQVVTVAEDSSIVQLVTDPRSTVGVRVLPSEEMGVATGNGMGESLTLDVLNPAARVRVGDQVVTLGSVQRSGIPAGLPVGSVSSVQTRAVASGRVGRMRPVTSMTSLDSVVVLTERR